MSTKSFETSLGNCTIAWQHTKLTGFHLFEDYPGIKPGSEDPPPEWIQTVIACVLAHLDRDLQDFSDLDYDFCEVSEFNRAVYQHTLAVKPGTTCSYGEIARSMGHLPGASRAVGAALGANPWLLLIPCHRVVASNGKMTGFSGAGGIKTKLQLLALEGAQLFAE